MLFELRVAGRVLRARPLFTAVAILTLAIGIGSNAAVFSVIDAVLLRSLPYEQAERLVSLYSRYLPASGYDDPYFALSGPEFVDVRARISGFAAVAAYDFSFRNLMLPRGEAERALTMRVTADFFNVLRVRPERGRTFTEAEAQRTGACFAVLSSDLVRRAFAGTDALGATIRVDDTPCEVVGVTPEGFGFRDDRVRVWTNLAVETTETPINRVAASLLCQTKPYDLLAFAIIPAALVPAALMACAIPAWRASRLEPIAALAPNSFRRSNMISSDIGSTEMRISARSALLTLR